MTNDNSYNPLKNYDDETIEQFKKDDEGIIHEPMLFHSQDTTKKSYTQHKKASTIQIAHEISSQYNINHNAIDNHPTSQNAKKHVNNSHSSESGEIFTIYFSDLEYIKDELFKTIEDFHAQKEPNVHFDDIIEYIKHEQSNRFKLIIDDKDFQSNIKKLYNFYSENQTQFNNNKTAFDNAIAKQTSIDGTSWWQKFLQFIEKIFRNKVTLSEAAQLGQVIKKTIKHLTEKQQTNNTKLSSTKASSKSLPNR